MVNIQRAPEGHYRLARIGVRNFKRFEHLDLDLERFNLLVGPNNSGKTTVLEACRLFDFCYRTCLSSEDGTLHFAAQVGVTEAELPIAGELMRSYPIPELNENDVPYWPPPIVLSAALRAGTDLRRYAFRLDLAGYQVDRRVRGTTRSTTAGSAFTLSPESDCDTPVPADALGVTFVPGFVGLLPREEPRPPRALRDLRAEGQYREIIRNLLLDLKKDPGRWALLGELLREAFPDLVLLQPAFDVQADRFIRARYDEQQRGRDELVTLDLFSAGSGVHQFVQILTAILLEDAPTVLLDEPDAHVFSRLQGQLYRVLQRLIERGYQIIAATHSPDLIAAAAPAEIVSFANGQPHRLRVREEVAVFAEDKLGVLENLKLLLVDAYSKIVVVEGPSDERYLRWWLEALLPAGWPRLQRRLVFLSAQGRTDLDNRVNMMLDALESMFKEKRQIRAFVVADRDHRLDEELEAERRALQGRDYARQRWSVFERVEIESYLLDPEALVRAVQEREGNADAAVIRDEFWQAVEASKKAAIEKTGDRLSRLKRGKEWSTIGKEIEQYFQKRWQGADRLALCDPKQVLPRLYEVCRTKWNAPVTDRDLLREVARGGAPGDLQRAMQELQEFLMGLDGDISQGERSAEDFSRRGHSTRCMR